LFFILSIPVQLYSISSPLVLMKFLIPYFAHFSRLSQMLKSRFDVLIPNSLHLLTLYVFDSLKVDARLHFLLARRSHDLR